MIGGKPDLIAVMEKEGIPLKRREKLSALNPGGARRVMEPNNTQGASRFLQRSPAAVRNPVMRRAIPFRKVGGRLLFIREELGKWILRCPGVRMEDLE